ncbi:MAG: septum site-determining protein MinC [Truepera sp.]|nr:septum site-determining protein MinC [Truepera sp.]
MKTRGTRGGIVLSLDAQDTPSAVQDAVAEQRELLSRVHLEVTERLPWELLAAAAQAVKEAGGEVLEVRPPGAVTAARGETVIITRTVRSGARVESSGSVIVLGDVNSGAELIAEDDIIVIGTLRGLAHAGAGGNEQAFIWAQQILSPQLRIAGALAQAGDAASRPALPEIARLHQGQIVLRVWEF